MGVGSFTVIGTPPPTVEADKVSAYALTSVFFVFSTITLVLRFVALRKTGQPIKLDGWLIIAGYVIALLPVITMYLLLESGLCYHTANLGKDQLGIVLRLLFALQRANQPSLCCIKVSILLWYLSIFGGKGNNTFRILVYINMAYTILWSIIGWCINLTVCSPIAYYYDKSIIGGSCKVQQVSGIANGATGAFGDVCILALPVWAISKLQLNTRKKLAVTFIFLLGIFTCAASLVRIYELTGENQADYTITQCKIAPWTSSEMQAAIISANLPMLAPLFSSLLRSRGSRNKSSDYYAKNGPTPRSGTHLNSQLKSKTSTSSPVSGGFERLSDDEIALHGNGMGRSRDNIELGDRKIHVKTEFVAVTSEGTDSDHDDRLHPGMGNSTKSWA